MNKKIIHQLNQFAFPLLIQMGVSSFIGASDVGIIGHISIEAFNASSLVMSLLYMVAGIFSAITIVLNIKLGESYGAGKKEKFSFEFYTSIFLSLCIGILFVIISLFFGKTIFSVLYNLDDNTLLQALKYLKYMKFYVLLQLILFAFTTSFKVLNKTKYILYVSIFSSVLDVGLDYVFVFGKFGLPKMGIEFVGFSTIATMIISIVIYTYFLRDYIKISIRKIQAYIKNMVIHLKLSMVLFLQEILDGSVYGLLVNMIIVRLGKTYYAGYVIINTILEILFLFKFVYGSAVLSMISVENGTDHKNDIQKYPKYASYITIILYLMTSIVILPFKDSIITLFSSNKEAVIVASTYLLGFIVAHIFSCISYPYKMALQAINQANFVLYFSIIFNIIAIGMMYSSTVIFNLSYTGVMVSIFAVDILYSIIFIKKYRNAIMK